MDCALTTNRISLRPLPVETLSFCGIANRAVTLGAVLSVVGMTVLAMGFFGVYGGNRNAAQSIFSWGDTTKMAWIDTASVAANVIHHHPFRNIPNLIPVRNPMRPAIKPTKEEASVAIPVQRTKPFPTRIDVGGFFEFRAKTLKFLDSHSFHICI